MAELPNRMDLEAEFQRKLSRLSARHRRELRELLGTPPDPRNVPDEFWRRVEDERNAEMLLLLLLITQESQRLHVGELLPDALQDLPTDALDAVARDWSGRRAASVAAGNVAKARERLAVRADYWRNFGGAVPSEQLEGDLVDVFGPRMDAATAATETTSAQTAGANGAIGAAEAFGYRVATRWYTRKDDRVCPVCAPLHGKIVDLWELVLRNVVAPGGTRAIESIALNGGPPAHASCRCFVTTTVEAPARRVRTGAMAESWDASKHPRHEAGTSSGGEFAPKSGGRFPASKMPKEMAGRVDLVDDNTGEILMTDDAEVIRQAVRDSIAGGDDLKGIHVRPEDSNAAAKHEEDRKAAEAKREAEREARRKADELGNKPGGSQWVAPPEKIYHATFAADAILKDGFKTADQLGSGSDVLGGSNRGNVSFTTLENARTYRDGLSVARDAAQGRIDPDDAKRMQEIGKQFGVAPDRMKEIVADSGDAPKEKRMFRILQRVSLEGQKFPLFMGTDWSKTVQSAAVPRILEIPSSGPKEYSYVKSETEWRIGDPHKITSIKRVE